MKATVFVITDDTGVLGVTEIKADAQEHLNNYIRENEMELISWEEGSAWIEHKVISSNGVEFLITIEEIELNEPF